MRGEGWKREVRGGGVRERKVWEKGQKGQKQTLGDEIFFPLYNKITSGAEILNGDNPTITEHMIHQSILIFELWPNFCY